MARENDRDRGRGGNRNSNYNRNTNTADARNENLLIQDTTTIVNVGNRIRDRARSKLDRRFGKRGGE